MKSFPGVVHPFGKSIVQQVHKVHRGYFVIKLNRTQSILSLIINCITFYKTTPDKQYSCMNFFQLPNFWGLGLILIIEFSRFISVSLIALKYKTLYLLTMQKKLFLTFFHKYFCHV